MELPNQQQISSAYSHIKEKLSKLYRTSNVETFELPPYEEPEEDHKFFLKQFGIDHKEMYKVLEKFDLPPKSLNDSEKQMRKKYLELIKKEISSKKNDFKDIVGSNPMVTQAPELYIENYDAFMMLVERILDLLILELEPVVCKKVDETKKCPVCNISQLLKNIDIDTNILILFMMAIAIMTYFMMQNRQSTQPPIYQPYL